MEKQQASSSSFVRASADTVGQNGIGLKPPAPFGAKAVQRVGEAKSSMQQPTQDQSAEVPDLTDALVQEIEAARQDLKNQSGLRQKVLDALLAYCEQNNVVEVPPASTIPKITTQIVYDHNKSGNDVADTQYDSNGKKPVITVSVFPKLFNAHGPAEIYSSIRHELIHAAQRTQVPNTLAVGAEKTDEYMFENYSEKGPEKDVGKAAFKDIQWPLHEIEAHVWEIEHASETGIDNEAKYLAATWKFLHTYVNNLSVSYPRASKEVATYYKGYVERAIDLLNAMSSAPPQSANAPTPQEMAASLQQALNPSNANNNNANAANPSNVNNNNSSNTNNQGASNPNNQNNAAVGTNNPASANVSNTNSTSNTNSQGAKKRKRKK